MKFEQIKDELPEGFRRLTGIKRTTFDLMTTILREAEVLSRADKKQNRELSSDRVLKENLI